MKSSALVLIFCVVTAGSAATEDSVPEKQREILRLIQNTNQLGSFRERVKDANDDMRKKVPELPSRFWDEVERDVDVNAYAQWLMTMFDRTLTIDELRALNSIFGNSQKKALLDLLIQEVGGKKGAEFVSSVKKFQSLHEQDGADEIVRFMMEPAARRYAAALGEIDQEGWDVTARLLTEARDRVLKRPAN